MCDFYPAFTFEYRQASRSAIYRIDDSSGLVFFNYDYRRISVLKIVLYKCSSLIPDGVGLLTPCLVVLMFKFVQRAGKTHLS